MFSKIASQSAICVCCFSYTLSWTHFTFINSFFGIILQINVYCIYSDVRYWWVNALCWHFRIYKGGKPKGGKVLKNLRGKGNRSQDFMISFVLPALELNKMSLWFSLSFVSRINNCFVLFLANTNSSSLFFYINENNALTLLGNTFSSFLRVVSKLSIK